MSLNQPDYNLALPIKVMIVDDSAIARNIFRHIIEEDKEIEIVASISNAKLALETIKDLTVEVILLDIEMPGMTGIEAIPEFLKINPKFKILMVSSFTTQKAPITLTALSLGASDYIEKPSSLDVDSGKLFKELFLHKIKILGNSYRNITSNLVPQIAETIKANEEIRTIALPRYLSTNNIVLRHDRMLNFTPSIIAIASSTGGPKAILEMIGEFSKEYLQTVPILITQHMPKIFTKLFAENIDKLNIVKCREAEDGDEVKKGEILVAPGGYHMLVVRKAIDKIVIKLTTDPPVNFCRPAADPMIFSICEAFKERVLLVVLTGMGHDALEGANKVVQNNGVVIAQDEKSSVVWGMPGNIAVSNLCSAVLPLNEIASYIMQRGK